MVGKWWLAGLDASALDLAEGAHWFDGYVPLLRPNGSKSRLSNGAIAEISTKLETLLAKETKRYHVGKRKNVTPDDKWIAEVIANGTLSDKVAALALKIQASPLHELETLDILIAMALRKEQRSAQLALEALKDLLVHNLLPDRKLVTLSAQDLAHESMDAKKGLLMWFEDKLVGRVGKILDALDVGLKSTVDFYKKFCMGVCLDLLSSKPEQEMRLLVMLINKFGDNVGGACGRAAQLLKTLISVHSAMKAVVVLEVNQFIFRPNLAPKAVYNAVTFLNQVALNSSDSKVAELLIDTYVSLFEKNVKSTESNSRSLAALLNGINRAYPYLRNKSALEKHMDSLFRIVHVATLSAATQALLLISFIALGDESGKDKGKGKGKDRAASKEEKEPLATEPGKDVASRYYRALYEKLQSDQILSRSRNYVFLSLLFRSIRRDPSDVRAAAFLKRVCVMALQASAPISAGLLFLVSEVCSHRPALISLVSSPETLIENDMTADGQDVYSRLGSFDALKREPEYACKTPPSLWELCLLSSHCHPSVAAFAHSLLSEPHCIKFDGDPIVEFSLASFLSRFSYKNAKTRKTDRVKSRVVNEEAINSSEFILSKDVAPHKAFFHKFFATRAQMVEQGYIKNRSKKKKASVAGEEDEEDELDRFADKLAEDLMTSAGGDDPDADDMDDFDLDGADESEDGGEGGGSLGDLEGDGENASDVGAEYELMAFGDDEDDDTDGDELEEVEEESKPQKGALKGALKTTGKQPIVGKKRKESSGSDFADAAEYEDIMEQIVQFHKSNPEFISHSEKKAKKSLQSENSLEKVTSKSKPSSSADKKQFNGKAPKKRAK